MRRFIKYILSVVVTALLVPQFAFAAQCACDPGPILPCCACLGNCNMADLVLMLMKFVSYALGTLGVVSVIVFIHAGFRLIIAHGNQERIGLGRKEISGAVTGFVIVLCSWVVINTIVVLFTGNAAGTLFPGIPAGQTQWWKIKKTPGECQDTGYTCKAVDNAAPPKGCKDATEKDSCYAGYMCCPNN